MAITYFVGKTYERIVDPTDPQDRLLRVFKVVGYDENDRSVEFIHFHDFYDRNEADSLLEQVQKVGPDREHLENSDHWEVGVRDTRSIEEKFTDHAERELKEHYRPRF